jgi:DNA polymerase III gamma/tau subunit
MTLSDETLNRYIEEGRAAGLTDQQILDNFDAMIRENEREMLGRLNEAERQRHEIASFTADDRDVAATLLIESGETPADAWRIIATDAERMKQLAPNIQARKTEIEAAERAARDAEYANSPEGRRAAASAALRAKAEREQNVAGARALIAADLEGHGVTAELAADLSDDEALRIAGLVQPEVVDESIEASYARMVSGESKPLYPTVEHRERTHAENRAAYHNPLNHSQEGAE